jgi:phosphoribosyl 1,2-cyclic phosphodiesterase/ActR/RegA family two-component response regulator
MRVRFWGTRGSIATPGRGTTRYGGNTSCVSLTTAVGEIFILDCGTGARPLGLHLMKHGPRPLKANILLGHTHWDHIQGFPFFTPAFIPGNEFEIYAPEGGRRSLHETLAGQMEYTYFPVDLSQLPSRIRYHELAEGVHSIGSAQVYAQYLHHPAMTLGYRVKCDGTTIGYFTDHEPFSHQLWRDGNEPGRVESILHEGDRRHARFMSGVDLLIHDSQYTVDEYVQKKNWGHSPLDYVVEVAAAAGVRWLALTHHDPGHDDNFVFEMEQRAKAIAQQRNPSMEVFCAYEGCELELTPQEHSDVFRMPVPAVPPSAYPGSSTVLVVADDVKLREMVCQALEADKYGRVESCTGIEATVAGDTDHPGCVVVDLQSTDSECLDFVRRLADNPQTSRIPIIVLIEGDPARIAEAGLDPASVDFLSKPFAIPQLRARVRARLTRAANETGS